MGNRLRLHTLVVFIAMVGGLSVFGASGLFLGPALVTFAVASPRAQGHGGGRGRLTLTPRGASR